MTTARDFTIEWELNPPTTMDEFIALKDGHKGTMDMQRKLEVSFPDESFVMLRTETGADYPLGVTIDKAYDGRIVIDDRDKKTNAEAFKEEHDKNPTRVLSEFIALRRKHSGQMHPQRTRETHFPDGSVVLVDINSTGHGWDIILKTDEPKTNCRAMVYAEEYRDENPLGLEAHDALLAKHNGQRHIEAFPSLFTFPDGSTAQAPMGTPDVTVDVVGIVAGFVIKDPRKIPMPPMSVDRPIATSWGVNPDRFKDTQTGRHDTGDNVRRPAEIKQPLKVPRIEVEEDIEDTFRIVTEKETFIGAPGHWWRADSREGVGDAQQAELDKMFRGLQGKVMACLADRVPGLHVLMGSDEPKTHLDSLGNVPAPTATFGQRKKIEEKEAEKAKPEKKIHYIREVKFFEMDDKPYAKVVIRTMTYGSSIGFINKLAAEVKKDWPDLPEEEMEMMLYGGQSFKRTYGIEVLIRNPEEPAVVEILDRYRRIYNLENTL